MIDQDWRNETGMLFYLFILFNDSLPRITFSILMSCYQWRVLSSLQNIYKETYGMIWQWLAIFTTGEGFEVEIKLGTFQS